MSIEFYAQRRGGLILPLGEADRRAMDALPERRLITLTGTVKAPVKLARWFFAALALLVEATSRWPTVEMARREIMIRTGFFDSIVIAGDGTTRFTAQSMAGWDASDWRAFLDVAIPYIIENHVGETRAKFRDRVDAFLGLKLAEAWAE